MRRITISLFDDERDALNILAQQERRDIRAQAAFLIRRDLRMRGLLSNEDETTVDDQINAQEGAHDNHN